MVDDTAWSYRPAHGLLITDHNSPGTIYVLRKIGGFPRAAAYTTPFTNVATLNTKTGVTTNVATGFSAPNRMLKKRRSCPVIGVRRAVRAQCWLCIGFDLMLWSSDGLFFRSVSAPGPFSPPELTAWPSLTRLYAAAVRKAQVRFRAAPMYRSFLPPPTVLTQPKISSIRFRLR